MGNGWSRPAGNWCGDLMILHMSQFFMKVMVSVWIEGHQNRLFINWRVAIMPGCPELGVEWTKLRTRCRRGWGTYVRLGGVSAGGGSVFWASAISVMMSHWGCEDDGGWKDEFLTGIRGGRFIESWKCICLGVLWAWTISDLEVESSEKECPSCLSMVESLGWFQILKISDVVWRWKDV